METSGEIDELRDQRTRELTAAMAGGSEAAYREFYENYFDRLFGHLLALTRGDETLARELVQRVLLRVVRYIKAFENERVLWAWLKQIARSCHVDYLRRERKLRNEVSVELLEEMPGEEVHGDHELMAALESGLDRLESSDRELVSVAYFDHWPHKKIAEFWNTTPKAIESRLGRIRQKLRKLVLEKLKDYALL